jgi:hypothetical protein
LFQTKSKEALRRDAMAHAVEKAATPRLARALWLLDLGAGFIGNVTPLYGVLYWQWDTFRLLVLYWMENRHPGVLDADALSCCFCPLQNAVAIVIDEARNARPQVLSKSSRPLRADGCDAQMLRGLQLCGGDGGGGGDAGCARRSDMN